MVLIEQLLSKPQVQTFRKALNQVPWQQGASTAMGMAAAVKQNAQADPQAQQVKQLTNDLLGIFGQTPKLMSAALPHKIFPPCFNRYCQDQTYGFHVDAAIMRMPHNQEVLRSDLSMTVFLSETDEYQGGELIIQTEFGKQKVKLAAGDAVLYPSSSLHKVTPVTQGQRIAAISWIQSLVPDSFMRQTLYELDQSIQALSQNSATDREQLDKLHQVYHNLIRQQSQV
ncbi:Fe2+-dependent dioxygenase [Paraglaciecola aestuariivivens]